MFRPCLLLAVSLLLPGAEEPIFLVQPYLQLPAPSHMTVMWETSHKLPSRVDYGLSAELGHHVDNPTPSILHEVALDDLQPGTTYHYRVRSGPLVSKLYTFKTAPPPGTKQWRLAVYGDSRSNPAIHRKVVEQIAKAKVDLIVHTGDIVANGKNHDSWRKEFFEPLSPLGHSVPWVSTIGNHESDSANYFSYMALPGNERYFGLDYGNAHIICLDSNGWIEKGRDSKQYQWLTTHLREPRPATWTFVAFHHPLFSAHATRPINPLRWDWTPVFLDPENHVDAVLTGHDHFYARNYRMGRLTEEPQAGVLFLTTAGGGASLYRSKARDYVAKEQSAYHFTLLEFDGDRITGSAISITGAVLDRFVLTKEPTPAEEFCAYEIEELRKFLRMALTAAPALTLADQSRTSLNTKLRVPTRFRVPVSGRLIWEAVPGWKIKQAEIPFRLEPSQPLEIPLQAEVKAGPFPRSPGLTIAFDAGRFHNRTLSVFPLKFAGPDRVQVGQMKGPLLLDGKLEEASWEPHLGAPRYSLLGLPPKGGRGDRVQFLADKEWLYIGAWLDDPGGKVRVKAADSLIEPSILALTREHFRVMIWDGKYTRQFALTPEHVRYYGGGPKAEVPPLWRAVASQQQQAWSVEMALPRKLFPDLAAVRVNVVHRHRDGLTNTDYELCPTYGMGPDADMLPDWKPREAVERFAHLVLP